VLERLLRRPSHTGGSAFELRLTAPRMRTHCKVRDFLQPPPSMPFYANMCHLHVLLGTVPAIDVALAQPLRALSWRAPQACTCITRTACTSVRAARRS
jgi:hypothetical protein